MGQYGRNEYAILGTPCGAIQRLAKQLAERLGKQYKMVWLDADHAKADDAPTTGLLSKAFELQYTDKITHHRFDVQTDLNAFHQRAYFNAAELILINGNHFAGQRQIVVLDPRKTASLSRKLDRLTDVRLFLAVDDQPQIPDFLKEHLPNWAQIPIYQLDETARIGDFLSQATQQQIAPIHGLVLAGGKSERMGTDKSQLDYHGRPQREHVANLLAPLCERCFISVRSSERQPASEHPYLPDTFTGLGPFGAIASAFREHPEAAWLVVACDLPLLDAQTLQILVEGRQPGRVATAFHNPMTDFPEPLICLWEPRSYPILLQFLTQGYSCPRKVLINSDVALLKAPNAKALMNANRPEEQEAALAILAERK